MYKARILLTRFFVLACLSMLVIGCQSSLSERGNEEMAKYIEKLAGEPVSYEILSAEEAPDYSASEVDFSAYTDGSDSVSGCPEDEGGREMWCVVLDREIESRSGNLYSHFLVQRLGRSWYVVELGSADEAEFFHLGCKNWDVTN